ncbi:superoxide dismutase [Clostridium perfringens]|uniref:superoxide dismutase n=1 Tax=Clostridium perfringens TaxID=1502 RepID=UPI002A319B13|nr:superoxide dismutase [Clostridium perfringens]MDM0646691.1 superoxide dismutase [Clostridium perfringens]
MKNNFLKHKKSQLMYPAYCGSSSTKWEGFKLKPLDYPYDALEPSIDEETVKIHHDKHQQAYVDKLNKALEKHPELYGKSLYDILSNLDDMPEDIMADLVNQGGGVYNHEFYWSILGKGCNRPVAEIADAIDRDFGSFEEFKEKFKQCGISTFGSGWAWLVSDKDGKLEIMSTKDQSSPISLGLIPILTMDVWEHAYYLKYQNRRPEYIDYFFDIINWKKCEEYYNNR